MHICRNKQPSLYPSKKTWTEPFIGQGPRCGAGLQWTRRLLFSLFVTGTCARNLMRPFLPLQPSPVPPVRQESRKISPFSKSTFFFEKNEIENFGGPVRSVTQRPPRVQNVVGQTFEAFKVFTSLSQVVMFDCVDPQVKHPNRSPLPSSIPSHSSDIQVHKRTVHRCQSVSSFCLLESVVALAPLLCSFHLSPGEHFFCFRVSPVTPSPTGLLVSEEVGIRHESWPVFFCSPACRAVLAVQESLWVGGVGWGWGVLTPPTAPSCI